MCWRAIGLQWFLKSVHCMLDNLALSVSTDRVLMFSFCGMEAKMPECHNRSACLLGKEGKDWSYR